MPSASSLPPAVVWKPGPEVKRAGDLWLLNGCSNQVSWPQTLTGQHNGAAPDDEGTGEPGLGYERGRAGQHLTDYYTWESELCNLTRQYS